MSGEDEEADESEAMLDDHEPGSARQPTKGPSDFLQIVFADFRQRSKGLEGAALQAEVDRMIEKIVDRAAGVAPQALRAKVRDQIYEMLLNDPTLRILLEDVRRTAKP